ncbi:MAG: hypothetical protein ACTHOD_17465 [Motilibacteraceae bacterium]
MASPVRRWVPDMPLPVGQVDGVEVLLAGVTVEDLVHVRLVGAPGVQRERLTREFEQLLDRGRALSRAEWAALPEQPGTRLMRVDVGVADDAGTRYHFVSGRAGGSGTEWEALRSFGPMPPAGVRELTLTLQTPEQAGVTVVAPLG